MFTPLTDGDPGACTAGSACCGGFCKRDGGQDCGDDADCCSGICVLGRCETACRSENGVCDSDADCCDGETCVPTGSDGICCASGRACGVTCCSTASQVCDAELICCEPDPLATTCAGRCGVIPNNCDQETDCGFPCIGTDPDCCDTYCTDLAHNLFHCGACENNCIDHFLGSPACCNGACRDLISDINHCGACSAPVCTGTAPGCCGGTCHDLDDDLEHCGVCFRRCEPAVVPHAPTVVCAGGRCLATACEAGYTVVAGACCANDRVCESGSSLSCCASSETCCSGECVDTQVDPRHCTGCGIACPAGATCAGGQCSQGSFGEVCSPTLHCVYTHTCGRSSASRNSCLDGRCCIPSGVSCTAPGGLFTFSGVCCCDTSKSCPSAGTC